MNIKKTTDYRYYYQIVLEAENGIEVMKLEVNNDGLASFGKMYGVNDSERVYTDISLLPEEIRPYAESMWKYRLAQRPGLVAVPKIHREETSLRDKEDSPSW